LVVDATGTIVHIALDSVLIFGSPYNEPWGIAGAGISFAIGGWCSVIVALGFFFQPRFREQFQTLAGWRFDRELFTRLMTFGGPAGLQWMLDALSFTLFTVFVGRLGEASANAASLTFTLNLFAFLPMMGMGQAVSVLVGQRIGANQPDIAERTTYRGAAWACGYMVILGVLYLAIPQTLLWGFEPAADSPAAAHWPAVAAIVPSLLWCVAAYSVADAVNVVFGFALRGAGDTRFVTWVTFFLAWPVMVIPTFLTVSRGGNIYWCWGYATIYIGLIAICFVWRFRTGKWKSMKVIEAAI
ncbi:MAG: MATE family efflux transporter, partial [Gemmataceae bacterium]